VLIGIFTVDINKTSDGFYDIFIDGFFVSFVKFFRIFTIGGLADFVRDEVNKKRLRDHVSDKLNAKYSDNPELRDRIKESLSVDAGAFGWRLGADIYRSFVTSDLRLRGAEVPALISHGMRLAR